jgi:protein TonB
MAHALVVGAAVLVPLLLPEALPELPGGAAGVLIFLDPPPPPPLPLPLGSGLGEPSARPRTPAPQEAPTPTPEPARLVAPIEIPAPAPEAAAPSGDTTQGGSPTGSLYGVPEGMEGGVEGGEIGGVPGGVIGGVIGGTGTGPVPVRDFDRGPRPLRVTKPVYPQEAFVKKVEGTVVIEIVIDASGQVARARIVQSIPLLDRAALACVREWLFQPALKQGHPVATVAMAPVSFHIY